MAERIVYHNPDHVKHPGWIDNEGKQWDVPERLFPVIDALLSDDSSQTEWMTVPEFHEETLDLIAKVHSTEMLEAIARASELATADKPEKTDYDKGASTEASAIYPGTFEQALMSAECAALAADSLTSGQTDLAVTVSRPPGHHAGREFYHGFCYFNPAAVAAEAIKESGKKVAILDFDIHHGDGTQDIFYDDPRVMYASLHADPDIVMPGTGHAEETGSYNNVVNVPLPIGVDAVTYFQLFDEVIGRIRSFNPDILIIEAGFDGHKNEFTNLPPITQLGDEEYFEIGRKISEMHIPSLVIFGGGYNQDVTSQAFLSYMMGMNSNRPSKSDTELYSPDSVINGKDNN